MYRVLLGCTRVQSHMTACNFFSWAQSNCKYRHLYESYKSTRGTAQKLNRATGLYNRVCNLLPRYDTASLDKKNLPMESLHDDKSLNKRPWYNQGLNGQDSLLSAPDPSRMVCVKLCLTRCHTTYSHQTCGVPALKWGTSLHTTNVYLPDPCSCLSTSTFACLLPSLTWYL